jgi:hypothetical protein
MNAAEAKEILVLYRPGTADASDPAFAEALRLCEQDPELKRWFQEHCAVHATLRDRFRQITVPEGLKQQILAERKVHTTFSRRSVVLAVVVAVAVLTGLLPLLLRTREDITFSGGFRKHVTRVALSLYKMDLETNDLTQIRAFFADHSADTGYVIPAALEKNARPAGCLAAQTWQGKPLSMICFHSGKPLPPDVQADVFLFVISDANVLNPPRTAVPTVKKINRATTASWSQDGRTYVLVVDGDEESLRKYL